MTGFKTKEEMFGDGGSFGTAVPFSTSNAPGTGTGNRGIAAGEQLTAGISNRPHYALALNDEDLNTRLAPFEASGLDAAYRLGTIDTAGGGRLVTLDGGPIELYLALDTLYEEDSVNAALRVGLYDSSQAGAVGYDLLATANGVVGTSQAAAGYLDRRAMAWASGNTIVSLSQAATCNVGNGDNPGSGKSTISLASPAKFHTGGLTTLIKGVDMVEILTLGHAALYQIIDIDTDGSNTRIWISDLGDPTAPAYPTFSANLGVTIRLFRPVIRTGKGYSSLDVAALDGPALALFGVPGVSDRMLESTARTTSGVAVGGGFLDHKGSWRNKGSYSTFGLDTWAGFGQPGFYFTEDAAESVSVGLVAHNTSALTGNFYGVTVAERRVQTLPGYACTWHIGVYTGIAATTYSRGLVLSVGTLLEVVDASTNASLGIYEITDCQTDLSTSVVYNVRGLDGSTPSTFTDGQSLKYYPLSSAVLGTRRYTVPGSLPTIVAADGTTVTGLHTDSWVNATITSARNAGSQTPVALHLIGNSASGQDTNPSVLLEGSTENGTTSILTAAGQLSTAVSLHAPCVMATSLLTCTGSTVLDTLNFTSFDGNAGIPLTTPYTVVKPVSLAVASGDIHFYDVSDNTHRGWQRTSTSPRFWRANNMSASGLSLFFNLDVPQTVLITSFLIGYTSTLTGKVTLKLWKAAGSGSSDTLIQSVTTTVNGGVYHEDTAASFTAFTPGTDEYFWEVLATDSFAAADFGLRKIVVTYTQGTIL